MHHPALKYPFEVLADELAKRVGDGSVRASKDPTHPERVLYCYSKRAEADGLWDEFVELSRGMVLDHATKRVVAFPFPKFFNFGERDASVPEESFEVFEKLDGSLGVIWHDGASWRVTTKGSFTAQQGAEAQALLDSRDTSGLVPGHTYCAEIIYPENRIVVRYTSRELVFLAAWDHTGLEYPYDALMATASAMGWRCATRVTYPSFAAMQEDVGTFGSDREGYVVRFSSGKRLKVKGAEYLRVHRLVSNVTPLAIWDVLQSGGDLEVVRREIPEEFRPDFDSIRSILEGEYAKRVDEVSRVLEQTRSMSDRDLGMALGTIPAGPREFLFAARKGGEDWHLTPRVRAGVYRRFRPTGNVLPGYTPSTHLLSSQEDV